MNDLSGLFGSRETRLSALDEDQRLKLEEASKASGDPDYIDRHTSALWLSQRTGIDRRKVIDNYDAISSAYFGDSSPKKAWDYISASYGNVASKEQEQIQESTTSEGGAYYGTKTMIAKDVVGSFAAGASQTGYTALGGVFSNVAAATGVRSKSPMENPEYRQLYSELNMGSFGKDAERMAAKAYGISLENDVLNPVQEEKNAEIKARLSEIEVQTHTENQVALEKFKEFQPELAFISEAMGKASDTMYELANVPSSTFGVREEFANTTVGKIAKQAGTLPVTALFAYTGPIVGGALTYSSIYGGVEQERKAFAEQQGVQYDRTQAFWGNVASAAPQAVMEYAFGMERVMEKILKDVPKIGGKISFGEGVKRIAKTGLASGAEEAITEPAQNWWNDYIASLTYDEKRELMTPEVFKERLIESASAFAYGSVFGGIVGGIDVIDRRSAVTKAERHIMTKNGEPFTSYDWAALRVARNDEQIKAMAPDASMENVYLDAANGNVDAQIAYTQDMWKRNFVETEGVMANGFMIGKVKDSIAIRETSGVVTLLDLTVPEQAEVFKEIQESAAKVKLESQAREEAVQSSIEQMQERFGGQLSVERMAIKKVSELREQGVITQEEEADAVAAAKEINKSIVGDGKDAQVMGMASLTVDEKTGAVKMAVKIAEGASPLVVVEEVAEAWKAKAIESGKVTEDELTQIRQQWHKQEGEVDPVAQGKVSLSRANTEWFSKRVVDYALANRKVEMPGGWGQWLRTLGERLKSILRGAARLKKLLRDGKVDPRLEQWMKESIGIGPAFESAKAFEKLTQSGDISETSFSLKDELTFAATGIPQNQGQQIAAKLQQIRVKNASTFPYPYQQVIPQTALSRVSNKGHQSIVSAMLQGAERIMAPIDERLRYFTDKLGEDSPLTYRLRKYDSRAGTLLYEYSQRITPLMTGIQSMNEKDLVDFKASASNQDALTRNAILARYGLQQAWAEFESVREELRTLQIEAGMDVGYIEEWFPRWVKDVSGLRESFGMQTAEGEIEKALLEVERAAGRPLDSEEVNAVINNVVRGVRYGVAGGGKPSNIKERKVQTIAPDQLGFYADPNHAIDRWLRQSTEAIARHEFFGKNKRQLTSTQFLMHSNLLNHAGIAIEESIGSIIADEVAAGRIQPTQQKEIQDILTARFAPRLQVNSVIRGLMDVTYMVTMGQIGSTLANLPDMATAIANNGLLDVSLTVPKVLWNNAKSLPLIANKKSWSDAVASKTKTQGYISRESLGVDKVLEQFADQRKTAEILEQVFKATGFAFTDGIGKEVLINSTIRKLSRDARKGKLSRKHQNVINSIFEGAAPSVVSDLAAGKITDDVKFLAYNILADWQPISLSQYPEAYLANPKLRFMWMMKIYATKQLASYRREGQLGLWFGDAGEAAGLAAKGELKKAGQAMFRDFGTKAEGARKLTYLMALLLMAGASKDWVTDFIMDRDPEMDDVLVDNIFKLVGVSRYTVWNNRNRLTSEGAYGLAEGAAKIVGNAKQIVFDTITPPIWALFERPAKDVESLSKALFKDQPWNFFASETFKSLPGIGAPIYWRQSEVQEKIEKRKKLKRASERRKRRE